MKGSREDLLVSFVDAVRRTQIVSNLKIGRRRFCGLIIVIAWEKIKGFGLSFLNMFGGMNCGNDAETSGISLAFHPLR